MKSVLVIDDDANMRDGLRDILEDSGYRAEAVDSGTAALERLKKQAFDVVLVDYRLPDGTGLEWSPRLRAVRSNIRVFLLTGMSPTDLPNTDDVDGVLTKPITPEDLITRLSDPVR